MSVEKCREVMCDPCTLALPDGSFQTWEEREAAFRAHAAGLAAFVEASRRSAWRLDVAVFVVAALPVLAYMLFVVGALWLAGLL